MGCTGTKKQPQTPLPPPSTISGILRITVTNGVLFHQAGAFKMDPYIILKLSNQTLTSKVVTKGGKKPNFSETFTFYINNSKKQYGRNLQMTLMDKKKIGADNFIGFGIVDLNPVINLKKSKDEFRCMLTYQYQQAGFVNIVAEFLQEETQTINFKFDQAIIRRNTSTFGSINCWVQVTIGEQTMKTTKIKDTKQKPPSWQNQTITVKALPSIKQCIIKVMDDGQLIGYIRVNISKLLSVDSEQFFVQDFIFQEGIYAGTLKFRSFKGKTPTFSQHHSIRKTFSDDKIAQHKDENYFGLKMVETNIPDKKT